MNISCQHLVFTLSKRGNLSVDMLTWGHRSKFTFGGYLVGQKSHPTHSNEF